MRFQDPYPHLCDLRYDWHDKKVKACHGEITVVAGIRLCERHYGLLMAIKRAANQEKRRHPVHHHGTQAA